MPANYRFLLDTNIIVHLVNRDPAVEAKILDAGEILIPIIAVGELLFGAAKSSRANENFLLVRSFVEQNTVLLCDFDVAREYGEVKKELKALGRPIPENDVWIAAIARCWDLTLVTRDQHFQSVFRLRLELC